MAIGLYRVPEGWVVEDSAWVRYDDGKELEVPRSQYEAQAYEPPFDDLPTKESYELTNAPRT